MTRMMLLASRRRARRSLGPIAALSASGLATGVIAWWFLDPRRGAEHRQQAQEKLRSTRSQVSGKARELGGKAAEAARSYQARASEGVRSLGERARGAADEVKATARRGSDRLEASGVPRDRALSGTAGVILLARAVMGGGLLRVPLALAGATLLSRVAGESEALRKGVTRTRDAARSAAGRLHDAGATAGGGARGERRGPEVREVKSPSELEPGVASGRPDPTFRDRADRSGPHMGGRGGGGGGSWKARAAEEDRERDAGLGAPGTDDVMGGRAGFDSPEPGAGVREEELGAMAPRETRPETEETPRTAGADEEPATRRSAAEADAAWKEPNPDGG